MTGSPNGRGRPRSKSRYVVAGLVAAATFTSGLQAQEPETADGVQAAESPFHLLAGVRVEYYGVLSPGASIQLNWEPPAQKATWLGMHLHAQMIQFYVDEQIENSELVRRDYHLAARLRAGFGRDDGPIFYGFAEGGVGVIGTQPEAKRGDVYLLSGVGAGAGLTLLPFTFAVEGTLGRADRPSPELMDSFVMTLSYRLP